MSEPADGGNDGGNLGGPGTQAQILLERLFLKDASFESPRSPGVFTEEWKPEFKLDINTRSTNLSDERCEIVLMATLRAKTQGGTAYIVEVHQAGVFQVTGLPPEERRRVLGTLCPATLFPYVRETVDGLVVKGGFPAVHLAPVNFEVLYEEAMRRQTAQSGEPVQH
jgi:preprotein translocase subunit SecB